MARSPRTALLAGGLAISSAIATPGLAGDAMQPSFAIIGHIESLTLDPPGGQLGAATITVGNIPVTIPANMLVVMPGKYMTAHDLFLDSGGTVQASSGLALADTPAPQVPFEAEIIGNITPAGYVAANVRISQGALHTGAGFIQAIDYTTGELRIGPAGGSTGARVRLNDSQGIYGLANAEGAKAAIPLDQRFELDPDNSPIHAKTGFPVCVPRSDPTALNDPKCPAANRPAKDPLNPTAHLRFTCATSPASAPAAPDVPVPTAGCNPDLPVPLGVGDYVTFLGILLADPAPPAGGNPFLIAAYGLDAELGIYTSPGVDPAYVFLEEAIQGTKGERFADDPVFGDIPQEETTRFRVVGFSTDPSRNVEVGILDSDRGTIAPFSFTGPGGLTPSNGPQLGRFRNTWPSKDNARAVRRDAFASIVGSAHAPAGPDGHLTSGKYVAPISEYIYPEVTSFGLPGFPAPVATENFCYLKNGGGIFETNPVGPVSPFPDSGHPLSQATGVGTARVCDGM